MLKLVFWRKSYIISLITVQDNTMLKHAFRYYIYNYGLITVQDNTMLKHNSPTVAP